MATGLPMAFQFGLNWAPFSESVGDFFGTVLGFEGTMVFMLEASFLGIMLFGWNRVPPLIHYLATILVAIGANLSTFWILLANSWLQTPAGGIFVDGKFVVQDYFAAIAMKKKQFVNWVCELCGVQCLKPRERKKLSVSDRHRLRMSVHHCNYDPGNNALENLRALCSSCHLFAVYPARSGI